MKHVLLVAALVLLTPGRVSAYAEQTHEVISAAATAMSVLGNSIDNAGKQRRLRLGLPLIYDNRFLYKNSKGDAKTIAELLVDGATFEDEGLRALNHFFDPRTGLALRFDSVRYQSLAPDEVAAVAALASTSPDWALGTYGLLHYPVQEFSYRDLKTYYFSALTNRDMQVRRQAAGLAFQTLGHIIHHIQDMAQPGHVRNDGHVWSQDQDTQCTKPKSVLELAECHAYWKVINPSFYEHWVLQLAQEFGLPLPLSGYAPVYGEASDGLGVFGTPRLLWTHGGRGIADFTSRNFLSDGTMDQSPPVLGAQFDMLASDLCNGAVPACGPIDLTKKVAFWPSVVDDQFRPATMPHPYAASWSIFTPDLQGYGITGVPTPRVINRFTIAYDIAYLLPRAVGYSAGFINYFFRGDMEIEPPNEGVFAIVDTHPQACGAPCGFRYARLNVRNTTPADAMGAGQMVLVAKYRLNNCYRPDLSGDDGGPAFTGDNCRSLEEYAVVSDPTSVGSVPRTFGAATTFFFPAGTPIPINASDLSLQVVFRGGLGQESDAIAVATFDVGEPNFVAIGNLTDYAFSNSDQRFHALPYGWNTSAVMLNTVTFSFQDPATTPALATVTALDGGQHAQFAFISKRSGLRYWLRVQSSEPYPQYDGVAFPSEEFFRDDTDTNAHYSRTCPVRPERGQYRQFSNHYAQWVHGIVARSGGLVLGSAGERSSSGVPAKYASDCYQPVVPGSGGLEDFSYLAPSFGPANMKQWAFNF